MDTKMAKFILYASLFVMVMFTSFLAGACSSKTTQTPVTTATSVLVSGTSGSEWEIDSSLTQYLIKLSTTLHGKQVFSKLVDNWLHGKYQQNQDGSWLAQMLIDEFPVKNNPLLTPIFKDPVAQQYTMEWRVSEDGLEFTASNDNAKRLEAELSK